MDISKIGKQLGDEIPHAARRNEKIMRAWMPTWIKNSIANVGRFSDSRTAEHVHSLMELEKKHAGKPAIIVGAGSTLDKVLDNGGAELLRDRGDAILICPNSLTRAMLGRGIEPDYYTALHPTPDVAWCWNTALRTAEPTPVNVAGKKLITVTTIHPQVIDLWLNRNDGAEDIGEWNPGDVYLTMQGYDEPMQVVNALTTLPDGTRQAVAKEIGTSQLPADWYGVAQPAIWNQHDSDPGHTTFPWSKRGQVLPELPNMGCIVNYSIQVAALLGCSPILLVGADYSFLAGKDGRFRYRCDDWRTVAGAWCRQEPDLQKQEIEIMRCGLHTIAGVAGHAVQAHEYHISYRNSCHALYNKFTTPDGKLLDVVNCSPDGALVELPRMKLDRALSDVESGEWSPRKQRKVVVPEKVRNASPSEKTDICIECGSVSGCVCDLKADSPRDVVTSRIDAVCEHVDTTCKGMRKKLDDAAAFIAQMYNELEKNERQNKDNKECNAKLKGSDDDPGDPCPFDEDDPVIDMVSGDCGEIVEGDDPAIADDHTDEEQELAQGKNVRKLCHDAVGSLFSSKVSRQEKMAILTEIDEAQKSQESPDTKKEDSQ